MDNNEIEVRNITTSTYKTYLSRISPEVTIAKLYDDDNEIGGLDIRLCLETPEDFKNIKYPAKWKPGSHIFIDFPFNYIVYVTLLECWTIYDLLQQIQGFFFDAFGSIESEESGLESNINYRDLVLDKIVICKTGDVVIYVSKGSERGE